MVDGIDPEINFFLTSIDDCQIFEKIFNFGLDGFIEQNKLHSDNRYGFGNNRPTLHALPDITKKNYCCAIDKRQDYLLN